MSNMSRRHAPERESGYNREERDDRRERETRTVQREREAGSRTPVRTTADVRPTTTVETRTVTATDSRSAALSRTVEPGENRDARDIVNPRSGPNPRDAAYVRDPRTGGDVGQRVPTSGRDDGRERDNARFGPEETATRQTPANDYFLPGDEISRDVITADICRYLGPDALVRPYVHKDGRKGFIITAYRALTSAMIATLKLDSAKFESENRRRKSAGHRPQTYEPIGHDQSSRMDAYVEDRTAPIVRVENRYEYEPEPRRPRNQPSYPDDMDIDDPLDSRGARYTRETYDPRNSQGRPQAPTNYTDPGRDRYGYDNVPDPQIDPRFDRRIAPRADLHVDHHINPRGNPRGYPQPASMPQDRDYPMMDNRTAYTENRTVQPGYTARSESHGGVPPSQAGAIPRGAWDETQLYFDPQTGRQMVAAPRPSEVRQARSDRDYDGRGYR